MNILFLTTSFPRFENDGVVPFVLDLARSLSKRTDLKVVTPSFPGGIVSETISGVEVKRFNYFLPKSSQRVVFPDGIPVQLKKSRLARIQAPFFLLAFLCSAIKEAGSADVLLCNWALTGFVGRVVRYFRRKPYVVIVRGSDLGIMKRGGLLGKLFIGALKNADGVCAVANNQLDALSELGVDNVHFTPNGIDHSFFDISHDDARNKLSLPEKKIVLFAGSMIEVKGVNFLVDAMKNIDARLVLAGDGCLMPDLRKNAENLNIDALFLGRLSREELSVWQAACDVFVLPSLSEGRPNVLIEAMLAGRACVASDIPGTRELIEDGITGFLVPPKNTDEMRKKISLLLDDVNMREDFERRGRKEVMKKISSWPECAEKYETILKTISKNN